MWWRNERKNKKPRKKPDHVLHIINGLVEPVIFVVCRCAGSRAVKNKQYTVFIHLFIHSTYIVLQQG